MRCEFHIKNKTKLIRHDWERNKSDNVYIANNFHSNDKIFEAFAFVLQVKVIYNFDLWEIAGKKTLQSNMKRLW